ADSRKYILDAMIELGIQYALLFLCTLARSGINVDAYCAPGVAVAVVRNENARLDPANLAPRSNNAIFPTIFLLPLAIGEAPERSQPHGARSMYTELPVAARQSR